MNIPGRLMCRHGLSLLALLFLAPVHAAPSEPGEPAPEPHPLRIVAGVSPFLEPAARNELYRALVGLVLEGLPRPGTLEVYDAYRLRSVSRIVIPDLRAFDSPKTRAHQFREPLQALRQFLVAAPEPPRTAGMDFTGALRIPQFLEFVAEHLNGSGLPPRVLLLGSPLHLDEKEPGFSMAHGYFPSDGHLLAPRDRSIYGRAVRENALDGVEVRLGYFGDPWASDLHRHRITRFWRLYIGEQGGTLAALTPDLPTLFREVTHAPSAEPSGSPGVPERIDRSNTKVEMLRLTRDVANLDWIAGDAPSNRADTPPARTTGPLKVGIRWQGDLDLDLYARAHPRADRLYFEHPRAAEGTYFKDHRTSPDREYEFIEFTAPVDLRAVEAAVNFYQGSAPRGALGEVRLEFDGRLYSGRFRIEADHGNSGREGAGQAPFWARLDLPRILGLAPDTAAPGESPDPAPRPRF